MAFTFKLILFGDGGVGKTTLAHRYVTGSFKENSLITIGVEFHVKTLSVDGIPIEIQIWDFAGEERFRFLLPAYAVGRTEAFSCMIPRPSSLCTTWGIG